MTEPSVRGRIQPVWPGAFDLKVLREIAAFDRAQDFVRMFNHAQDLARMIGEAQRLDEVVRFGQEVERLWQQ